jgi:2-polyprenyl-3-methyl-5-hydroxy-6-metoxy-1,4-benzoquinol methylase
MKEQLTDQYFDREYFVLHKGKKRYIAFLCDLIKESGARRVLDIGCGFGFFLEGLDDLDYCTYGIDFSKSALKETKKRSKAGLAQASSIAIPFKTSFFDAVTMFDVIEHVHDYETAFREIHRILKPGGYIFLITLNANSLLRHLAGKSWSWYMDPTHVHIFSASQIENSLFNCGFREIRIRTFFNLHLAGETTKAFTMFRSLGKVVFLPKIGDSMLAMGRAEKRNDMQVAPEK